MTGFASQPGPGPDPPQDDLPNLPQRVEHRGQIDERLVTDMLEHIRRTGDRLDAERESRQALQDQLAEAREALEQEQAKREELEQSLTDARQTIQSVQEARESLERQVEESERWQQQVEPVVRRVENIRGSGSVDVIESPESIEINATPTRTGGGFRGTFLRLTKNNQDGKYDGETVQYSDENGWEVRQDDDRTLTVVDAAGRDDLPLNDGADVNEGAVYHAHPLIDHGTANAGDRVFVIEGDGLRVFPVNLTKDGSTNTPGGGDNTTQASWTYTAKSLDNSIEYGTGLSPDKQRPAVGKVTDGGGKVGLGYFDQNGDFQLYDANEIYTAEECT